MAESRTITIHFPGDLDGLRRAWNDHASIQAFLCPRGRLADLNAWKAETSRPGAYLLIGADEFSGRKVYIGEGEQVLGRASRTLSDIEKRDDERAWDVEDVILITGRNDDLDPFDKTFAKYIEGYLIKGARAAGRYDVQNKNASHPPTLSVDRKATLDGRILGMLSPMLVALGHRLLELRKGVSSGPASTSEHPPENGRTESSESADSVASNAPDTLVYTVGNARAWGRWTGGVFVVLKGSTAYVDTLPSALSSQKLRKQELLATGKLVDVGDGLTRLTEDIVLQSPSAAANVISRSPVNGWIRWKDAQGRTVKELEAERGEGLPVEADEND